MDLFEVARAQSPDRPLAERLRPKSLDDMVGQPKLLSGNAHWRKQLLAVQSAGGFSAAKLHSFWPAWLRKDDSRQNRRSRT